MWASKMPGLSSSFTSALKEVTRRWNSLRSVRRDQSSKENPEKSGTPPPMSRMSSTARGSTAAASSLAFLAGFAFACHSFRLFTKAAWSVLKASPGWRFSMRDSSFLLRTQVWRYSLLLTSFCHSKLTASKPSALFGMEKLPKALLRTLWERSGVVFGLNQQAFSSSVSSTSGGDSPMSSSSSFFSSATSTSSSFFSSSPSFFSAAAFLALASSSAFFLASAAALARSAMSFLRSFSAFLAFQMLSAFVFLAARIWAWTAFL
mmetsp:Transcript_43103/g.93744  ORF Transcript_43103/g.93744 Transcript_43103/m.93744 type:complete len:262 (+) Transcript_43103:813-1598(+)